MRGLPAALHKPRGSAGKLDYPISKFPNLQIALALAAVDGDAGAADPAGAIRGEEHHEIGDFVGAAEAAERQLALDHLGDAGGIRLLPLVPRAAGKHDRSRRDAVDADVRRRELLRERLREADLGGLDGVVR